MDEDDEVTDIREQIFHNTVREQIVSNISYIFDWSSNWNVESSGANHSSI